MYVKSKPRVQNFLFVVTLLVFLIPMTLRAESGKNLAVMYEIEGDIQKEFNAMVLEKYPEMGYHITDPHQRVNDQYKKEFNSTILDVLSFMSIVNDEEVMPLLAQDERLGGFSPFNMLIYKTLAEKNTHIGHLTPEAILETVGIEDEALKKAYIATLKPLDEMVEKEFPNAKKSFVPMPKLSEDRMIKFEYEFERLDDLDEFIEEFQNSFEMAFINKGYLIAGFHNFMDADDAEEALEDYDLFWTYSLCHLEFSFNLFDGEGARPDAGLYAPCSMYMYLKKDSNKLIVGMPRLRNWAESLQITDEKRSNLIQRVDREVPEILAAYGMKSLTGDIEKIQAEKERAVTIKAEVAKVPEAQTKEAVATAEENASKIESNSSNGLIQIQIPIPPAVPTPVSSIKVETIREDLDLTDRSIKFSKRVPPNYSETGAAPTPTADATIKAGEVNSGRIATYLRGTLMEPTEVEARLQKAGFTILATVPLDKKSELISVVFTNKELTAMASKANRGFGASLRVLVNKKENEISITNPLYMLKAFLQADFNEEGAEKVLATLRESFEGVKNSEDMLKYQALPSYQFMSGMPHYEDMVTVAKGETLKEQLQGNPKVYFTQPLDNDSTLIGVALNSRTNRFTQRIGTNNAGMLPYPILIENGEAKIMDPKYYISVMYPMLQMSQFMMIATVPGAMEEDCKKIFK